MECAIQLTKNWSYILKLKWVGSEIIRMQTVANICLSHVEFQASVNVAR